MSHIHLGKLFAEVKPGTPGEQEIATTSISFNDFFDCEPVGTENHCQGRDPDDLETALQTITKRVQDNDAEIAERKQLDDRHRPCFTTAPGQAEDGKTTEAVGDRDIGKCQGASRCGSGHDDIDAVIGHEERSQDSQSDQANHKNVVTVIHRSPGG